MLKASALAACVRGPALRELLAACNRLDRACDQPHRVTRRDTERFCSGIETQKRTALMKIEEVNLGQGRLHSELRG